MDYKNPHIRIVSAILNPQQSVASGTNATTTKFQDEINDLCSSVPWEGRTHVAFHTLAYDPQSGLLTVALIATPLSQPSSVKEDMGVGSTSRVLSGAGS